MRRKSSMLDIIANVRCGTPSSRGSEYFAVPMVAVDSLGNNLAVEDGECHFIS